MIREEILDVVLALLWLVVFIGLALMVAWWPPPVRADDDGIDPPCQDVPVLCHHEGGGDET